MAASTFGRTCRSAVRYTTLWGSTARPNRAAQHLGVTKVDLNRLGKYPDFDVINEQCSRVIGARNPGLTCGFDR